MNTFRDAAQRFADRGWDGDDDGYVITSRSRLQPLVYDEIREDTDLHSDLTVVAVNHAADALTGCVDRLKEGERTSKPVFTSNTTVYNTNAITYFEGCCSLAAYGSGRVHAEYEYPDDSLQAEYIESDEWTKQGAKLRYDRQSDTYYLHVSVTQERENLSEEAESRTVLGVDRNTKTYLERLEIPAVGVPRVETPSRIQGPYRGNRRRIGPSGVHQPTVQSLRLWLHP